MNDPGHQMNMLVQCKISKMQNYLIVSSKCVKFLATHFPPNGDVHKLKEDLKMMMILVKLVQAEAKTGINNANLDHHNDGVGARPPQQSGRKGHWQLLQKWWY
jgi:hypothetical protein